jgi:hypothetical protein
MLIVAQPLASVPVHGRTTLRRLRALSIVLAMIAFVGHALAQRAPTSEEVQQARARWEEGRKAFDAGQYEKAHVAFRQAYSTLPHPAFLQNLGETELRIGRNVEAARHFAVYLRDGSDLADAQRRLATESLKKAAERLGAIVVGLES